MTARSPGRTILRAMNAQGWASRLVSVDRRWVLWRELEDRRVCNEFDEAFFTERLAPYEKATVDAPGWARSILIVAIPDPMVRIRFGWDGRTIALTVPPTFLRWEDLGEPDIERVIADEVAAPVQTSLAILPKKPLAARSGLARYGRNNLAYIDGMGSYHRLCAVYTDAVPVDDDWREPEMLDSCAECGACVRACPSGAIDPDRFLVRAERCITYWQEKPPDVPLPSDPDCSWGDQFIGCMRCQSVCPQNRGLLTIEEVGPPFTEAETATLVRGVSATGLPGETLAKVKRNGILEYLEVLPRNLPPVLRRLI